MRWPWVSSLREGGRYINEIGVGVAEKRLTTWKVVRPLERRGSRVEKFCAKLQICFHPAFAVLPPLIFSTLKQYIKFSFDDSDVLVII
jgi:hypothetical protein